MSIELAKTIFAVIGLWFTISLIIGLIWVYLALK